MNWREAREASGRTLDDVVHEWRNRDMPDAIKYPLISRSTLSRFERGLPTELTVFALAHLAALLGYRLSEIDPEAAETYNALTAQDSLIPTCNYASPERAAPLLRTA